jgi:hypothetical protein
MERRPMIIRLLLAIVIMPLLSFRASSGECEKGCQTIIVVKDCSGTPVANAKIQVKLCCGDGGQRQGTSNASGEATFGYCLKDICESKVILNGFAERAFDRGGCSESGKISRCEIKVCTR